MPVRLRRSALFMPGANARALEKARTLPADAVMLDLEDSVAPGAKAQARDQVCAVTRARAYAHREVVIRVNALDTPWGADDLAAACQARPDAILIPKVSGAADVTDVASRMARLGGEGIEIWLMIETPRAVLDIGSIAQLRTHLPQLGTFIIGANDLAKETRATLSRGRSAMTPWLSQIVLAARAYGLDVMDSVYNDHADTEGFRAECAQARDLGMDGKSLIHPAQIAPCNEMFSPSADDIAWARQV